MGSVTKISISLPTPLADALKAESDAQGIPVSQLVAEQLERRAKVARFRQSLADYLGPITDDDRLEGLKLLASARTPDEILDNT
jgi:hypothetical protein